MRSNDRQTVAAAQPRQKRGPVAATLRIGPTRFLPEVLRDLGVEPAEVLAEAGFDLALFDNPGNLISFAARGRLLGHCVARTGCQHLGLLVGQRAGLDSLGLPGLLVKYSPDVGTALRSLVRYLHLQARGAATTLTLAGDVVTLDYAILEPQVAANDQVGDGAVALMFNIMRELCGPDWTPVELQFAHRKPRDVGPFRRLFRAPLRFDAEQNAVVFAAAWLGHRQPGADPLLRGLLQKEVDALEVRQGDDFQERVRSVLRTAIITGHAGADQVAALFSMHPRTLHRRLAAVGTGFQDLADETRHEIARQMLQTSALNVTGIATMLDYADASAFTRAFRRWSGTTPARWRATQKRKA